MVGLIPVNLILFLAKDEKKKTICSNELLCEMASKENMEFRNAKELVDLKSEIRELRPEILLIDEEVFLENIDNTDTRYFSNSCRPFVLVLASSGHTKEDTFRFLRNGADDVIGRDVSEEEFVFKSSINFKKKINS